VSIGAFGFFFWQVFKNLNNKVICPLKLQSFQDGLKFEQRLMIGRIFCQLDPCFGHPCYAINN
jgi:hypothetical protein